MTLADTLLNRSSVYKNHTVVQRAAEAANRSTFMDNRATSGQHSLLKGTRITLVGDAPMAFDRLRPNGLFPFVVSPPEAETTGLRASPTMLLQAL